MILFGLWGDDYPPPRKPPEEPKRTFEWDYFLISPVRHLDPVTREEIGKWVAAQEAEDKRVYWPARDTDQDDPVGTAICQRTLYAIRRSEKIAVWWDESSEGRLFDFGMAYALGKTFEIINPDWLPVTLTPHKSYRNVLLTLAAKYQQASGGESG